MAFHRATAADAGRVIAFERQLTNVDRRVYLPYTSYADAAEDIRGNCFFLLVVDDAIVGTASFRRHGESAVYIGNIAVAPAVRCRGIAKSAVLRLMEMNPLATEFALVTHPANAGAQCLYRALGFETAGYERPPFDPDVEYVKMVKNPR